jgi:hypothetical protein
MFGENDHGVALPLDANAVNGVSPAQAGLVRKAVEGLAEAGRMDAAAAEALLSRTG